MLDRAAALLAKHSQVSVVATSRWYKTSPAGGPPDQPAFCNGAALIETSLGPTDLLATLRAIENGLGRVRRKRWEPRTIDLDILLFDEQILEEPSLVLPHPRMAWRRFVLEPAVEIAPSMVHPTSGWTVAQLLEHLNTTPPYVAMAGGIGAGKTLLAGRLAPKASARLIAEELDWDRLEAFYADPASHAWETELEFLRQRTRLLAADAPIWAGDTVTVSDFWFDQSLAFAGVWLSGEQREAYRCRWQTSRRKVARPRLIVLLDASAEELHERVRCRGRDCEQDLSPEQLDRIHKAVVAEATARGRGPVLRLAGKAPDQMLEEALAAVAAATMPCVRT